MSFNPLNAFKQSINNVSNNIKMAANTLQQNISAKIENINQNNLPLVTENSELKEEINSPEQIISMFKPEVQAKINLAAGIFNDKFASQFIGCYSDDPLNLSMQNFLGNVSDIEECITLGKNNEYKFVGIQQGNKCYASNNIPDSTNESMDKCNILCNDINSGYCGGYYYNQVYSTNIPEINKNEVKNKIEQFNNIIENYKNLDVEYNMIENNINKNNINCNIQPVNAYILFLWLIIIFFIIFLVLEYYNKK